METTKLYIDLEFSGLHRDTTIISLAIVAEDGRFFYGETTDYAQDQINDWLRENILSNLLLTAGRDKYASQILEAMNVYGTKEEIKVKLEEWLAQFEHVTLFGDVPHFDWVLFTSLWGTAFDIPKNVYYICFDLATYLLAHGHNPDVNREKFIGGSDRAEYTHNCLHDAMVIKKCFERIEQLEKLRIANRERYLQSLLSGVEYKEENLND